MLVVIAHVDGRESAPIHASGMPDLLQAAGRLCGSKRRIVTLHSRDEENSTPLVLKFAPKLDAAATADLRSEVHAMRAVGCAVDHAPCIAPVVDWETSRDFVGFTVVRLPPFRVGAQPLPTLLKAWQAPETPEVELKSALFQSLAALWLMRRRMADFRHNDFKTDNVLLTLSEPRRDAALASVYAELPPRQLARLGEVLRTCTARAVVIDFETVHAPSQGVHCAHLAKEEAAELFGICAVDSPWMDTHLLLYDSLRAVEDAAEALDGRDGGAERLHARRAWLTAFVCRWLKADWMAPPMLTPSMRLHPRAQEHAGVCDLLAMLGDESFAVFDP